MKGCDLLPTYCIQLFQTNAPDPTTDALSLFTSANISTTWLYPLGLCTHACKHASTEPDKVLLEII